MKFYFKGFLNVVGLLLVLTNLAFAAQKQVITATAPYVATPIEKPVPSFVVSAEPLWLLLGGIGAKAEYSLTDKWSIGLGGIYIPEHKNETSSNSKSSTIDNNYRWSYSEINFGPTYMITGNLASNGVYVNTAVGYVKNEITQYGDLKLQGKYESPQVRATMGYQWINQNIRIVAGGGVRISKKNEIVIRDGTGEELYRGNAVRTGGLALDFQVGFMF